MGVSIRGNRRHIRILQDGRALDVFEIVDFNYREDAQKSKSFYVGSTDPETDKNVMGWSGSFTTEVKHSRLEQLIQEINDAKKNGVADPQITIVVLEEHPDYQSSATFIFTACILVYENSRNAGGQEKVTKSLSFESRDMRVES